MLTIEIMVDCDWCSVCGLVRLVLFFKCRYMQQLTLCCYSSKGGDLFNMLFVCCFLILLVTDWFSMF